MNESQGSGSARQISISLREPDAQQFGNEEINLGDEATAIPSSQVSESQSGLRIEGDDHVGDQAKAPAEKLAASVGAKLKIQSLMEARVRAALFACTADLHTFEDIIGVS